MTRTTAGRFALPTDELPAALDAAGVPHVTESTSRAGRTVHVRTRLTGENARLIFWTEDPEAEARVTLLNPNGVILSSVTLHAPPTAPLLAAVARALIDAESAS